MRHSLIVVTVSTGERALMTIGNHVVRLLCGVVGALRCRRFRHRLSGHARHCHDEATGNVVAIVAVLKADHVAAEFPVASITYYVY
jgi:hypothetical protein